MYISRLRKTTRAEFIHIIHEFHASKALNSSLEWLFLEHLTPKICKDHLQDFVSWLHANASGSSQISFWNW